MNGPGSQSIPPRQPTDFYTNSNNPMNGPGGQSISVTMYNRGLSEHVAERSSPENTDVQSNFLADYVRKKTKRFYLGGFESSVTENVIAMYVMSRGPKVSKINIFGNNSRPPVIRLNLEDDGNADMVTEFGFWPEGIVCRPWVSKPRYRSRNVNTYEAAQFDNGIEPRQNSQGVHLSYQNIYSHLRASSEVD